MKASLSTVIALAQAAAAFSEPAGHHFQAPGPNDSRSPCPGLNSLANHGFLNRNGKNITVPQLVTGGAQGLGIGQDFMVAVGNLAMFSPAVPNGVSFDLADLGEHNFPIEHDVSLSRQDYYFHHDDTTFYPPNYDDFISHFDGHTLTSLETSAAAREQRIHASMKTNPDLVYGPQAFLFGYGETGLYTQTMGMSPLALSAPVSYVKSLFQEQRLPYLLGWQPSALPITLASLGVFITELYAVSKERLPDGLYVINKGSYAQFIAFQEAIAGKIYNETHGLG